MVQGLANLVTIHRSLGVLLSLLLLKMVLFLLVSISVGDYWLGTIAEMETKSRD